MAENESGEKTELPTEKRRNEAREKGDIARSTDLNAAVLMIATSAALSVLGKDFCGNLGNLMQQTLGASPWIVFDRNIVIQADWSLVGSLAVGVLPLMGLMFVTGLSVSLAQAGFQLTPDVLQPNFGRINPLSGFSRIFSMQSLVRLAGSLLKIAVLGMVAYIYIGTRLPALVQSAKADSSQIAAMCGTLLPELGYWLAGCLLVLGLLDYGYQFWKHEQDLMMSKQELRDEMKEMDGDPQTRARRRDAHRKLAEGRELQAVKTADVVVTNPTELAVAIKYDADKMAAPIVVAKGADERAATIRRIAKENGVPIVERKPVARAIYKTVKVGQAIPEDLYAVFAEILSYVYRITGKKPKSLRK